MRRGLNKKLFRTMLGFSGWNLFGSFSGVMENQGINLVLNFFYGPVVNAARGVANQINGAVQSFVLNITMPVRPQVTQSYSKGDMKRTMGLTYGVSKMSSAVIMMIAIPACIEMDYLLRLWLGGSVPDHTALFTILILATSLINNLNAAISNVVHATGVMRDYQLWASIVRVSSVPIAFILIKYYDVPELALLAVLVCAALTHLVCLIISRRLFGLSLREYTQKVVLPVLFVMLLCILLPLAFHYILPEGLIRLIIVTFISVVTVGLFSFYIAFDGGERALVLQLVGPFINKVIPLRNTAIRR